jgi:hypothetical protein
MQIDFQDKDKRDNFKIILLFCTFSKFNCIEIKIISKLFFAKQSLNNNNPEYFRKQIEIYFFNTT